MDANAGEKPTAEQQSEHGTGQLPSSGQEGLTLFAALTALIQRLDVLIDQNQQLIEMMLDDGEQGNEEEVPTRYLNGQRIS